MSGYRKFSDELKSEFCARAPAKAAKPAKASKAERDTLATLAGLAGANPETRNFEGRPAAAPARIADWQRRYREALAHHRGLHPEAEAASLAWGEMVNRWHRLHGERVAEWQCAGCMAPIGGREALACADGNRVHLDTFDCLLAFGRRWRGAATRALAAMGLQPPPDDGGEDAT